MNGELVQREFTQSDVCWEILEIMLLVYYPFKEKYPITLKGMECQLVHEQDVFWMYSWEDETMDTSRKELNMSEKAVEEFPHEKKQRNIFVRY